MFLKEHSLLFSTLAFFVLLVTLPSFRTPHKLSVQLSGSSTITVPADRATISLHISSEGPKQNKVADEVRETADEILSLLRPLTLPPKRTSTPDSSSTGPEFQPPIATLSVNTFSSQAYPRSSFLGEKNKYSSSITITAEFRSLAPLNRTSNRSASSTPGQGFRHLSLVLPSLAKLPHTKIDYLKWFISPDRLALLQSETRQNATSEALLKIHDYVAPMQLRYPLIRCLKFHEHPNYKSFDVVVASADRIMRQGDAAILYGAEDTSSMHDEMDDGYGRLGYDIEEQGTAVFGLEPRSIELASRVDGDWVVVERGLFRTALGFLL